MQQWQIKLESLIKAPITKIAWNSGRSTGLVIFLLCCVCKLGSEEGGCVVISSGQGSFDMKRQLFVRLRHQLEGKRCDVPGSIRVCHWFEEKSLVVVVMCDGIRHGGETYATSNKGFYGLALWRNLLPNFPFIPSISTFQSGGKPSFHMRLFLYSLHISAKYRKG